MYIGTFVDYIVDDIEESKKREVDIECGCLLLFVGHTKHETTTTTTTRSFQHTIDELLSLR